MSSKITVWYNCFVPHGPYLLGWATTCTHIDATWTWPTWLWPIFGTVGSNKTVFKSIVDLYNRPTFTYSHSLYCSFMNWCFRIKQKSHNTLHVPQCELFSDTFICVSVCICALCTNTRWYKKWKVLCISVELLVTLGSLAWENLGLILAGRWDLNLYFQVIWCWEHLLDLQLDITLKNSWLEYFQILWHMGSIFDWSITLQTDWLDDWH